MLLPQLEIDLLDICLNWIQNSQLEPVKWCLCRTWMSSRLLLITSSELVSEFIFSLNFIDFIAHIFAFYQFKKARKKKKKKFLIRAILTALPVRKTGNFFFFSFAWKDSLVLDKNAFLDCKKIQFVLKGKRLTPLPVTVAPHQIPVWWGSPERDHCGHIIQELKACPLYKKWCLKSDLFLIFVSNSFFFSSENKWRKETQPHNVIQQLK